LRLGVILFVNVRFWPTFYPNVISSDKSIL